MAKDLKRSAEKDVVEALAGVNAKN